MPATTLPRPFTPADQTHMARALALAEGAIALSEPNPRVGCVITSSDGRVLGEGFTQQAGGPHAEIMALRDAAARGADVRGATAYVTLEPCSHHGRTPPCCDALVAAGLARVVAAVQDPNELVSGRGTARLRAAGIQVEVGLGEQGSRELNIGFFSRMQRGRPWVRLKAAVSLDGRSALENGLSQWITGEAARTDGHAWRRRAGAVLTGIGTVRDDDPRLDVRLVPTPRQPLRVVLDSRLTLSPTARILDAPGSVLVLSAAEPDGKRADALRARGADVLAMGGADGRIDLPAALAELARRGVNELHVEAGRTVSGAFAAQRLVDEYLVYMAPKLIGRGRDLAGFGPLETLDDAVALQFHDVARVGADLRLLARP
ncbi:bifunctional diaminohydroxyphosphoribosylaminopyrimidine deaminase/5-amino-6-(5-phosphoribosylamino)uracil reductase RibD [Rhizobacter sp. LjRoot28]|uniref:bifunctional diaminohydroxyphosphoribosylaminopyrimidine deaminase/5-amino-6-(5-phosphoribosylamino)uracil reductase RibD n=1 Tax=Rhizobacter sp. LjRoot28 TaxID=3342309 RepID=UPI003ECC47D4